MERFNIDVYTDGSCLGNPGPGGWASILIYEGNRKVVCGRCHEKTTNNRMELTAVVEAIKALKKPCNVTVHTDSTYVCMTRDRWYNKPNLPNRDLWVQLIESGNKGQHKISFVKVAGHSGDAYNELCDKLAKEQAMKARLNDGTPWD